MKFEIDTTNKTIKVLGNTTIEELFSLIDSLKDGRSYKLIGEASVKLNDYLPKPSTPPHIIQPVIPKTRYDFNDSITGKKYVHGGNILGSTTGVATMPDSAVSTKEYPSTPTEPLFSFGGVNFYVKDEGGFSRIVGN